MSAEEQKNQKTCQMLKMQSFRAGNTYICKAMENVGERTRCLSCPYSAKKIRPKVMDGMFFSLNHSLPPPPPPFWMLSP